MSRPESTSSLRVCVVGAGLSGTLMALLLSQLEGAEVHLFEKRGDAAADSSSSAAFGASTATLKRSINLALSYRGSLGLQALDDPSIYAACMKEAIRMPCRVIHNINGTILKQPYGQEKDAIWSISRQKLNLILIENAKKKRNIQLYFGYTLQDCSKEGVVTFLCNQNELMTASYDLVIGADGAYSITRECMLKQSRINFSRQYIQHGYKELSIPPNSMNEYALPEYQGLHIWPRGEMMLIALPNADKSFTATLFAPYHGTDGFDQIHADDSEAVQAYFRQHFPDVVKYMPHLLEDYKANPVGSLVTIRVSPWNLGKVVLIGDAAHAVVPFYGQGMNCGFEDCYRLYKVLQQHTKDSIEPLLAHFSEDRSVATDTLADLCLKHHHDMAANTMSSWYLLQKRVEKFLHWLLPSTFLPLYTMVTFTAIPYHKAVERARCQDRAIAMFTKATVALLASSAAYLFYLRGGASHLPLFNRIRS